MSHCVCGIVDSYKPRQKGTLTTGVPRAEAHLNNNLPWLRFVTLQPFCFTGNTACAGQHVSPLDSLKIFDSSWKYSPFRLLDCLGRGVPFVGITMAADFFFGLVAVFRVFETGFLDTGGGAGGSRMAEGEGILIVSITI